MAATDKLTAMLQDMQSDYRIIVIIIIIVNCSSSNSM